MPCIVEERYRAQWTAALVEEADHVVGVDVLAPAESPYGRWTVEITLDRRARGVPPTVAERLGEAGYRLCQVAPQGADWKAAATR